jgi:hypothetical protein
MCFWVAASLSQDLAVFVSDARPAGLEPANPRPEVGPKLFAVHDPGRDREEET